MNLGFWEKFQPKADPPQAESKPILALAPMADVTDVAFREMFARYGKPDVMFTEFVSTDGLCSVGRKKLLPELKYTEEQRPIVAQIWGATPEHFYRSAQLITEMGFDGIDINMGCPQSKEIEHGSCAALIQNPKLAKKIIKETQRGAGVLPVSVKTRLGYNQITIEEWLPHLLEAEPAVITLHGRTKKEMSKLPAHWDAIMQAVKIRNQEKSKTLILGNGDIKTLDEAYTRVKETGVDGVMVGRGAFGNPWFFNQKTSYILPPIETRLRVMLEHARLFEQLLGENNNFVMMRKHFKAYCSGFRGASSLRARLMQTKNLSETETVVSEFLNFSLSQRVGAFFTNLFQKIRLYSKN